MPNKTVKISSIIQNQLPQFVREEFPLAQEFLSQYYSSIENQSLPIDLIENIDAYIKIDNILNVLDSTPLISDISTFDDTIFVDSTYGFPETYGLLQINSEIITYKSKTENSFNECVRGFSGITSYQDPLNSDRLIFSESEASSHISGENVTNLSVLFLKEFLIKIKKQITPGFEGRNLYQNLDQRIFIKQSKDFYSSKGTDNSFKILFRSLYGTNVEVIRPREYLIQPSDAQYRVTKDLIVEPLSGDPTELTNGTLYQDQDDFFLGSSGTITHVEKILREDKEFYLIKLDYDYNKDIDVDGTIKGQFKINPKTIITSDVPANSNYIDVDSTIGFPNSGELVVVLDDGTQLIVEYKSKTLNQFFECSGISQEISSKKELKLNKFVYGYSSKNEIITLRITGVLSDLTITKTPYLYTKDDTIQIKTLGDDLSDIKSNSWFFNISTNYNVERIELVDSSDFTYRVLLYDNHNFVIGDSFTLTSSSSDLFFGNIIFVRDKRTILIRGQGELNQNLIYNIKKNISKVDIIEYPELNFYSSNVQNVYYDLIDSIYITSPSLPTYLNQPIKIEDESITFFGSFDGYDLLFKNINGLNINHFFYTGDAIVYKSNQESSKIVDNGIFFVKKINDFTIRLSKSRENLFNNIFVYLSGNSNGDRIERFEYNDRFLNTKILKPQNLIRKLSNPIDDNLSYETEPGSIGMFVNGVELLNYKSKDKLFYGPIEEIIPTSGGNGYDVINPPNIQIFDKIGVGCVAYASISGGLERIDILDPGFDYIEIPKVVITGGSGLGSKAKVNLISYDHQVKFNSVSGVDLTLNTITFGDFHKFRDSDEIVYDTDGNSIISGLVRNSTYFVFVVDEYTIKLHKSFNDSVVGINTINLIGFGSGIHILKSKFKKKKIGSIDVENSGFGYKNRKTSVSSSGINTSLNIITIKGHGYQTGEIVKYDASEISIGGLSSSHSYYINKINDDQFRLYEIGYGTSGITTENKNYYLNTNQYVKFTSIGSGQHYFNYEPIQVKIIGKVGVSSIGNVNFDAVVNPIFRGEIYSTFVEFGGKNYGSEEIINYNRQPQFIIDSGSGAQLTPIISDGKIVDIIIQSSGNNYYSSPDLVIIGSGKGCVLTPILSNGSIIDVKIISPGIGYRREDTTISVIPSGLEFKFEAKIKSWRINSVERGIQTNKISEDDGFIRSGITDNYGIQYTHLYAPRNLRSSVLSTKFENGVTVFVKDLQELNGKEIISNAHSPIIGWSYDGNPIYGPYGFSSPSGGSIRSLESSYEIKSSSLLLNENRPRFSLYPAGFFVEDYEYTSSGDLDEFNGRFCVTPEYPNGIYAYFCTINSKSVENSGIFKNYKKPVFPYVIGNKFKSRPIEFNFDKNSNQDFIDINQTNWVRNTTPYNLLNKKSGYEYIFNPNKERKQLTDIKNTSTGYIDRINVINSGENYRVSDKVIFDNIDTEGRDLKAEVNSIKGLEVERIYAEQIEISDVEIIPYNSYLGIKTDVSVLRNGDTIRITTPFEFDKEVQIKLKPQTNLTLTSGVASTNITGIITFFSVAGIPNDGINEIFENDLFEIGNEIIKILDVDKKNNKIKVERNLNDSEEDNSHPSGKIVAEKNNKFITNLGLTTSYNLKRNKEFYFESNRVVGLGTTYGVGITSTRFLDVENFRSEVSIGIGTVTKLFFSRDTEKQRYSINNFINIIESTDPIFNADKIKVIGIGNTYIEVDFDTSSFSVGGGVLSYINKWKIIRVPTRSIEIPNHDLETNTPITYHPPEDGDPIKVVNPKFPDEEFDLSNNIILYPFPINENLIGISTEPIDISTGTPIIDDQLLFIVDPGSNDLSTGKIHSFETNYEKTLKSKLIKNVVTVETKSAHGLQLGDNVNINCTTKEIKIVNLKYNDSNRRLIIGSYEFINSDVDIQNNSIRIENHQLKTGQKIIHESSIPCLGLVDQKIYYVFVEDQNTIRLAENPYEIGKDFPNFIDIDSKSFGTLSLINPPIDITQYSTLRFDLSDTSLAFFKNSIQYPAFDLSIYTDIDFKQEFISTKTTRFFEVKKIGTVGTEGAYLEINFNENVPKVLFYKLNPINIRNNTPSKVEIVVDDEQIGYNKIDVSQSKYNGSYFILDTDPSPFNFKYTISNYPEKSEYTKLDAVIEYNTTSKDVLGPINDIKIISSGKGYKSLPRIEKVESQFGKNCILELVTSSIGTLNSFEITDIGFNYSSDLTIRPKAKLPEIIKVKPLSIIDSINVISIGRNYISNPDLIMIDGETNDIISDIKLELDLKTSNVKIINNTEGISGIVPKIIPINNSNGIGISSISYNVESKNVILTLSTEFSDSQDFPFEIGDKILVENVSVFSNERGYNSENYDYELFVITDIDPNIGGFGATITYNMGNYYDGLESLGTYDSRVLRGSVVPEKYFPIFDILLKKRSFSFQEEVFSSGSIGIVENWDENNEILKVSTNQDFYVGNQITGQTSKTKAIIKEVISFDGFYDVRSSSVIKNGWKVNTGFLNNEFQRIHDSDYYQYFSYSLKSNIDFNNWDEPVQNLNHTVGFKKFSDLIVESNPTNVTGLVKDQNNGDFFGISDFYSEINLNCINDYDLVKENSIKFSNSNLKSNEIYFETKILQDYIESVGNRVLLIDNISNQFNSNPRPTPFEIIDTFDSKDFKYRKYFIHAIDKRFSNESELSVVSLLQDGNFGYLNQYGKIYSENLLGSYDFLISGTESNLLFYPNKFEINNYDINFFSFDIGNLVSDTDELSLGDTINIKSYNKTIPQNSTSPQQIIEISSSYAFLKAIVQISSVDNTFNQIDELNIIHDGNEVYISQYGQLISREISSSVLTEFGMYTSTIFEDNLIVELTPTVGYSTDFVVRSLVLSISIDSVGVGSTSINNNYLNSNYTLIGSENSPSENLITTYSKEYTSSYSLIAINDKTNNNLQLSELLTLYNVTNNEIYITEYGNIYSSNSLGEITAEVVGNNIEIYFKPIEDIECEVRVLDVILGKSNDFSIVNLNDASFSVGFGLYRGTKIDIKKSFELTHNNLPIFERTFDSENPLTVNLLENKIRIPENYFVNGEEVTYVYGQNDSPIEIYPTDIPGIGITTKLPETLYIIKVDELDVQVAFSASNALSFIPNPLKLLEFGVGNEHKFISKKQNSKSLILIDNLIQSPIVGTSVTSSLIVDIGLFDGQIKVSGITSFFSGDLIKIDNEIMKVVSVGFGSTNTILVDREWIGTELDSHFENTLITKVEGNYNIVNNIIHFSEAPYGKVPIVNLSNRLDEVDYVGLETSSTFSGRIFLRNSEINSDIEPYFYNYIFDSISNNFNGYENQFTLKSNSEDVVGFSSGNSITLINDIFQIPSRLTGSIEINGNYTLNEDVGVTSITFTGSPTTNIYDVNTSSVPRGGIIVSVGSTKGFGLQPLVSAGGTAIVSTLGTIESISIGNSGSGYRSGIQTFVNVGVQTESKGNQNITYIGTANIIDGNVVGVSITNPGFGYTNTNPPKVIFDAPLSYSNIPLIYSESSVLGFGTGSVVDIVVGQGSSVISFELKNYGFGYGQGEILTIGIGGTVGIPTNLSVEFEEFQIYIEQIKSDKFASWHFGDLQVLDPIDDLFDGNRKIFPIRLNGNPITIKSKPGSNIDVQSSLLIFINDILQVPGESYVFDGGSVITFKEPPKGPIENISNSSDTSTILFYRGTGDVDTIEVDILESIKVGDELKITSDNQFLKQKSRTVEDIKSISIVGTNLYSNDGISEDELLVRPVTWCKQTEDKIINGIQIGKDRILYEPLVYPTSNIIKNIDEESDEIFVENLKTFFDSDDENNPLKNKIVIISQDSIVSASATAIVSSSGTIQAIDIVNGGVGYTTNPLVIIENPVGTGVTSILTSSISGFGTVSEIQIANAGSGYTSTNPPQIIIEAPVPKKEVVDNVFYEGDFGRIVGIKPISVGSATTGISFDFYIPNDSFIRDSKINAIGVGTTGISGIKSEYYFVISNSNIGFGLTSLDIQGNIIGSGTSFIDGIYQAISVSIASTEVLGVGITEVTQVIVSVEDYNGLSGFGFSNFYGNYSWGRISDFDRLKPKSFISYNDNLLGISSSPIIRRYYPLKYRDYKV
jgi:hypothetical protein